MKTAHSSLAAAALLLTLGSASAAGLLERKVPENICGSFSKESCAKYHFFDGTMTTTACMVNKDNKCVMTKGCSRKELAEPCTRETIKMVEEGDDVKVEPEARCDHCASWTDGKEVPAPHVVPKEFENAEFKSGQKLPIHVTLAGSPPIDDDVKMSTQGLSGSGKPTESAGPAAMGPAHANLFKGNDQLLHPKPPAQ